MNSSGQSLTEQPKDKEKPKQSKAIGWYLSTNGTIKKVQLHVEGSTVSFPELPDFVESRGVRVEIEND